MTLRIIFAGTPEFALPTLKNLLSSEHTIVAVYTQPDRPSGRGQQVHASPVKQLALSHQVPVFQPATLRDEAVQEELKTHQADVMIVVAYGFILPAAVLTIPRLGCINLHPSLLPRWRGAAPIPRCVEAGDTETGISIMQMDAGMDTGPILKQEKYFLMGDESSEKLHAILSLRGAELILETVTELENGIAAAFAQDNTLATHAKKIDKKEAVIDWQESAVVIANKIRAFNDWPVANTLFQNQVLRIWEAEVMNEKTSAHPGVIISAEKEAFYVATGDGVLKILSVQLPGKKRISIADFVNAHSTMLIASKTELG